MILITGGAGFIGSHLSERLLKLGFKVFSLDNFDSFYDRKVKEENLKESLKSENFRFFETDIRDKEKLQAVFTKNKDISLVVHLAAKAGVRPSVQNPSEFYDVNVKGTLNILEVMNENGLQNLIFASSSSVYGNNKLTPYSEENKVDFPISPYAATKKSGELLNFTFHHLYKLNVINLRFFTVYGPRQRPDLAIRKFFNQLYTQKPIEIFGDGTTCRDYTYIDDIIEGIVSSINYLKNNNKVFEIINLGNNNPIQLNDLIELIEKTTEKKFIKINKPMQQGDVNLTYADISKANLLLNYFPKISIEAGIRQFKNWYEKDN